MENDRTYELEKTIGLLNERLVAADKVVEAARKVMGDSFRSPENVEALYKALAVYYHEDKQPTEE